MSKPYAIICTIIVGVIMTVLMVVFFSTQWLITLMMTYISMCAVYVLIKLLWAPIQMIGEFFYPLYLYFKPKRKKKSKKYTIYGNHN